MARITLHMVEEYAATIADDGVAGDFDITWACPIARVGEIAFGEPFEAYISRGRINGRRDGLVDFDPQVTDLIHRFEEITRDKDDKTITGAQLREAIAHVKQEG